MEGLSVLYLEMTALSDTIEETLGTTCMKSYSLTISVPLLVECS